MDFGMLRPFLEEAPLKKDRRNNAGGGKAIDPILMFNVLFLQRYYGLGGHQIRYRIVKPDELPQVPWHGER